MPAKGQHHCLQIDYVVPDVTDDSFGSEGGDEEVSYHVDSNKQLKFFMTLLQRCSEPSMFLSKAMEALKTAMKEPLYNESKDCTKEWTVF